MSEWAYKYTSAYINIYIYMLPPPPAPEKPTFFRISPPNTFFRISPPNAVFRAVFVVDAKHPPIGPDFA